MEIKKSNIKDENINNAFINFKVEKGWLAENNADEDDVVLNRYTTFWEELSTSKINSDAKHVYYKAITPSFSYFAISVKEKTIPEEAVAVNMSIINVTAPIEKTNETKATTKEVPREDYSLLRIVIIAVVILIVLASFVYWKRAKRR